MDLLKIFLNKKAILFDLDGVIVDSDRFHNEAKREAVREAGFNLTNGVWDELKHYSTAQIYDWLTEKGQKTSLTKEEFIKSKTDYFFRASSEGVPLFPGALDFVKFVKSKGLKTALVTATRKSNLDLFLDKLELNKYFDILVTGDDVSNLKPSPEAYEKAMALLKLEPLDCVVVEDNQLGVASGKAAGCVVVGKISTLSSGQLFSAGADYVFEDFEEITSS